MPSPVTVRAAAETGMLSLVFGVDLLAKALRS
jgi:hypothetical protein